MSIDELQKAFKIRIDPATKIVYMLPQDIIDNTIKAFSTSATSPSGYGALGAPTGRYFAPANGPDCIQEVRGDCAPRDVFVRDRSSPDSTSTSGSDFGLGGPRSFDLGIDVFNLFNAINFTAIAQANTCADDQPTDQRLSGSERDVRSGRAIDAAGVSAQLLAGSSGF